MLTTKPSLGGEPRFIRRDIVGPDGKSREGWELWLGEHCFGRADNKEALLSSLSGNSVRRSRFIGVKSIASALSVHDRIAKKKYSALLYTARIPLTANSRL